MYKIVSAILVVLVAILTISASWVENTLAYQEKLNKDAIAVNINQEARLKGLEDQNKQNTQLLIQISRDVKKLVK